MAAFLVALTASAACADQPGEETPVDTSASEVTTCTGRIPDRTAARISDLPFQTLDRGALPAAAASRTWSYPTNERTMPNNFGAGRAYNEGHEGADLGGRTGDPIYAAGAGTVAYVLTTCPDNYQRRDIVCGNGWGNHVVVRHGEGLFTRYAHLSAVAVKVGQTVAQGAKVGALGHSGLSDGPHLHFELGVRAQDLAPCGAPQNFDKVFNPAKLRYGAPPTFAAQWCVASSADGVANVRAAPNGAVQHTLTNGGRVWARAKDGDWYAVDYSLFDRDWQGFMHTSVLRCP